MQTGAPELQTMLPEWQTFAGVHAIPSMQGTHAVVMSHAPLGTVAVMQCVPAGSAGPSTQRGGADMQSSVPVWQVDPMHDMPCVHGWHAPIPSHTIPVPHCVPAGSGMR